MAAIATLGSQCSGHDCFAPRPGAEASTNVKVNNIGVHTVGDAWNVHQCDNDIHAGNVISGSSRVFVNGKPVARIGDGIAGGCASLIAEGSTNVFAGG